MAQTVAGSKACQGIETLRLYCIVAIAVPQTEAPLFVPNKVAGGAVGNAAKSAGINMRPPPPTMESTKPASMEASVTKRSSMEVGVFSKSFEALAA